MSYPTSITISTATDIIYYAKDIIVFATRIFVSLLNLIVMIGGTRFFETSNSLKTAYKQEQTALQVSK